MIPSYHQRIPHAIAPLTNTIKIDNLSAHEIGWLGDKEAVNGYKFRCQKHQSRAVKAMTK